MANISKIKREKMLNFLGSLCEQNKNDDQVLMTINEIKNEINSKKYGLVWEEHDELVNTLMVNNIPVFTEDISKTLINGVEYNSGFLIEGDNLHSLYLLKKTHKNRIDVIYIDPPYNTGKNDFIFDDSFLDRNDKFRHSKWLSFMEKRLKIARDLLADQGVILISIDDNEYANLKLLCDEVFDESNFIASYLWKKTDTPPSLSTKVRKKYEYVLCYGNNVDTKHKFSQGFIDGGDAPLLNGGNPNKEVVFPKGSVRFNIPDGVYSNSPKLKIELIDNVVVKNGVNDSDFRAKGIWKWSQETILNEVSKGTYFLVKSNIFSVRYQRAVIDSVKVPQNNINDEVGVGTNEDAAKELKNIFEREGVFSYPKPTSLIKFLIKMVNKGKDITVLDFFAGSGTTGQAVIELNEDDQGCRKLILCTDNSKDINAVGDYLFSLGIVEKRPSKTEKKEYDKWFSKVKKFYKSDEFEPLRNENFERFGISQRITYQRLKTIISGIRENNSKYSEGIKTNLFYYKTDFVSKNEEYLTDVLLTHIKEMVQLEHNIVVDDNNYLLILDEEKADVVEENWDTYLDIKGIYISRNVRLSTSQNAKFSTVEMYIIPNYYFDFELKKVGETS